MISFFTTTKPFRDIAYNQQLNAIHSWVLIDKQIEVFVFSDDIPNELQEISNIIQVKEIATQYDNLPLCNAMFEYVAQHASNPIIAYLNSDIILPHNFGKEIHKIHSLQKKNYLLIGQRIDFDLEQLVIHDKQSLTQLYQNALESGKVHPPSGSDYFVIPREYYKKGEMPFLTVGRPGWDLWPIFNALEKKKAKIIDLSKTLFVIHQNHPQAYRSVHDPDAATIQNLSFLPKHRKYYYTLERSNYEWFKNKIRAKIKMSIRQRASIVKQKIQRQINLWKINNIKVSLGSNGIGNQDWMITDINDLDLTSTEDFKDFFLLSKASHLVAEHVWEHLSKDATDLANSNCYRFLKKGGRLRIAVPDGFHPDPEYIEHVRPGGTGTGADDHKVLYNYKTLSKTLEKAGFKVELLEYWDENGAFHFKEWFKEDGFIRRSSRYDQRNVDNQLNYTSLIVDGFKK